MRMRSLAGIAALAAVTASAAACSSSPQPAALPGTLSPGTAQITIDGRDAGTTHAVSCSPAGFLTTIKTGDDTSGISVMVSNQDALTAEAVSFRNVGGFTGSYNAGLGQPDATVSMTGRTYDISGTAQGFRTDNASFSAQSRFTVKVAC
ncbi:lipoprotein LpqH [Mycobacterium sp. BMJ-28]